MIKSEAAADRQLKLSCITCDLVVIGGGLAGTCCAVTAARAGLKVTLIQDRPVLGGNASSEVRLWILGATSHMGNNNRWAREGGVIDEILVENVYRNPEGNPLIVDTIILEKVVSEPNIRLLLNTAVHDLEKGDADTIKSVRAFCSQNSTAYEISAPLFVDASGDGIVGFLAGAAFRMGAEAASEFGEKLAPDKPTLEMLGHTIYFYSKDTGRPVKFTPPSFALNDITRIPRWRNFNAQDFGCRLWWVEWGGASDTIHEAETIKWELWKVVYGIWNHIKNSGKFPEAETLTLEWVGTIPGKRESRRFEGDYMLTQGDIVEQRTHADAVSFGGWAIDLHPSEGVFSEQPGCSQWHSKGVFQMPYRCFYSRNIKNLFLAGRIISASHVAFGATRVMATCAHGGQAVGMAAAQCFKQGLLPRDLLEPERMTQLQRELIRNGQYIPGVPLDDVEDLARHATVTASSELCLSELKPNGETLQLSESWAMMLPVQPGPMSKVTFLVDANKDTTLRAELRVSCKTENHTPDVILASQELPLVAGSKRRVELNFKVSIDHVCYAFVCLMANENISVHLSEQRLTGILSVAQKFNRAVAKSPRQEAPPGSGIDSFEFWLPQRRPHGKNFALTIDPPVTAFGAENITNGISRPTNQPNAWVADFDHEQPILTLKWSKPQLIARLELLFDSDYDHPMESVLMGHPERVVPFCVRNVVVLDGRKRGVTARRLAAQAANESAGGVVAVLNGNGNGNKHSNQVLAEVVDNHHSRQTVRFESPVTTDCLELCLVAPSHYVPAALFEVRCYSE